jgi:hypothetical protein
MKNSIEYLINEISEILGDTHLNSMQYLLLADALKRAKEMHKEEIIISYRRARFNEDAFINSNEAEDYYNKTYNQNK